MVGILTRQQFIDAIEEAIEHEDRLKSTWMIITTDTERMMLRHVGKTATTSARGGFKKNLSDTGELCFCPLSAAGISDGSGTDVPQFWSFFDLATADLFDNFTDNFRIVG